jgi:hypothetical protein
MLTVFATGAALVAAGALEVELDPPHADAVTAIAPITSPTPITRRGPAFEAGLRCVFAVPVLELMWFTVITSSALSRPVNPGRER